MLRFLGALSLPAAILATGFYTVNAGERSVVFNKFRGVKDTAAGEGLRYIIPFIEKRIIYDIKTRPRSISTITGTKDLQNVSLTIRVLFRPRESDLSKIYKTLGEDYDERILPSIANEVLKAVVARYDAIELISQRSEVSQEIRTLLTNRLNNYGILLDDVSIIHLAFGKEFMVAVEMKQVAQQEAEKARYLVEKAEQEKRAAIISAEGDAAAAEVIGGAFEKSGDALITLRQLEAAEEIAKVLTQSKRVTYLPHGQSVLLNVTDH